MTKYGVIASNGFCTMDFTDWAEDGLELDEAEYVKDRLEDDGYEAQVQVERKKGFNGYRTGGHTRPKGAAFRKKGSPKRKGRR